MTYNPQYPKCILYVKLHNTCSTLMMLYLSFFEQGLISLYLGSPSGQYQIGSPATYQSDSCSMDGSVDMTSSGQVLIQDLIFKERYHVR